MKTVNRTKLDPQIEEFKKPITELYKLLESEVGNRFYISLWLEKRRKMSYQKNLQGQNVNDNSNMGIVMRLFDGDKLFEEATNELELSSLKIKAKDLADRANLLSENKTCNYKPATWQERLQLKLESEISSQLPEQPKSDQWVHFGTRLNNSLFNSDATAIEWLSAEFSKLEKQFKPEDIDFISSMISLQEDHFLFMDSEVQLSQSISRNMGRLMAMKGDKTARVDRGGLGGLESFAFQDEDYDKLKQQLKDLVQAERLKPGRYKVVMGPGITGVFAHEAFGHTQEGDTWARGRSKAKHLFEKNISVGNDHATILNNPAIFDNGLESCGAWGSYFFDEEGWFSQEQVLVEKGKLRFPMTHLLSSQQLNIPRTANGKRENWSRGIYTRQTNTYFSPGDKTLDELIADVDYGFLAEECAGGMEDPKGMGIQVGILYVKEIKDGKLTGRAFQGPGGGSLQMTGSVPEYLNLILGKTQIDPQGKKAAKHPFNEVGGCGKYHKEFVYAGCGGPYMLVDKVLLG